jgi:hypothetical protein
MMPRKSRATIATSHESQNDLESLPRARRCSKFQGLYATAMKNAIPGARLEIVEGEGHELRLANPAKANPIMLTFVKQ